VVLLIYDLVLLHPPTVYDFRKEMLLTGPISDVVPSSSVFEMYPIGMTSIADYLERYGLRVKLINIAYRMLNSASFDVEKKIQRTKAKLFGIDLHWLPHAQGSLELAKIVKKHHPDTPVIFGGLSSTYFHQELIQDPHVDFVMRGDSTEKLMLLLFNLLEKGATDFTPIPNLTWKRGDEYISNPLTYVPKDLDEWDIPGYRYAIRSVFKYRNFFDPLPYKGWIQYPNTALLTARGCTQNCLICGGARDAYRLNCSRQSIALRSPAKLAEDITFIQRFSRAPIFIIHDIRQGGPAYVEDFFVRLQKIRPKNELVFELFHHADEAFFQKINQIVPKYSLELTLESHDEAIRHFNGKFTCSNQKVIDTIRYALEHGCSKIDLFFMIGIPKQDYESAMKNITFCEQIHQACGNDPRLSYFVAPLAPFLDPASPAFENPTLYGYKKFCHTLEDHCKAMLQTTWREMLSYETEYMSRQEIVKATYDSALALSQMKLKYELIDQPTYDQIEIKIRKSMEYIEEMALIKKLPADEQHRAMERIRNEFKKVNPYSICGRNELKWEVKKHYANFFSLTFIGLELLIKDLWIRWKQKLGLVDRKDIKL
jgi:B12-binding domain/radical SAM domain protein